MSSWLTDVSANRHIKTYVKDFLDISGSLMVRNGNVDISGGTLNDISVGAGSGTDSFAIGINPTAAGTNTIAIGKSANTNGDYSTSIGMYSNANGTVSIGIGYECDATGANAVAVGRGAKVSAHAGIAIGYNANSVYPNCVAIGQAANAFGNAFGTAVGPQTLANAQATALGWYANADGYISTALGRSAKAIGANSIAIGYDAQAHTTHTVVIGHSAQAISSATVGRGVSIGYNTKVGQQGVCLGYLANAQGTQGVAIGMSSKASGANSIGVGFGCNTSAANSIAIGSNAISTGSGAVALGRSSTATGERSTAVGGWAPIASGYYSLAVGSSPNATANHSIAIGTSANATSIHSIGIGYYANARNNNAVAIGYRANASGTHGSTAVGYQANASGQYAVALGHNTTCSGTNSACIGVNSNTSQSNKIILGDSSHMVGIRTNNPTYPLHVYGYATSATVDTRRFDLHYSLGRGTLNQSTSIYAQYSIGCGAYVFANSDRRIKTNIVEINDNKALNQIRLLNPCRYTYKDTMVRGSEEVIGFIAQEVKEVIPEAVKTRSGYIPNVMIMGSGSTDSSGNHIITIPNYDTSTLEVDLSGNIFPKLQIVIDEDDKDREIVVNIQEVISETELKVEIVDEDITELPGEIYVYGQDVDNFHTLIKDRIFAVGMSALQEIDRQQQADKARITTLESQLADVLARLSALESA